MVENGAAGRDEGSLCPFHSNGKWEAEEVGGKSLDGLSRQMLQPPPPPPLHRQDPGHLAEHLTSPKGQTRPVRSIPLHESLLPRRVPAPSHLLLVLSRELL